MSAIVPAHAALDRPREIGGKARGLAWGARAGATVPAWFVVSSGTLAECLGPEGEQTLRDALASGDERCVNAVLEGVTFTSDLRQALTRSLATVCEPAGRVAVRSSAADEDGARHSFAGQFDSLLNVEQDDVEASIRAVWRSAFSARVLAYRLAQGLHGVPQAPAVIVQRMVDARIAGVAFSADPIGGRRGIAVVSAVPGLGAALVSGETDAETWYVDRRGAIVDHRRLPAGAATLTGDDVRAVARLARDLAAFDGRPQDVEWAIEGDRLLLLQTRPITTLADRIDPDAPLVIWDNSNIVESYSGVTTPMTFAFASDVYAHVYRQFCRILRVPGTAIAAHDDVFRNMLGLIRGRLFYNLLNWHRVLALLPGYRLNRRFMEQMMGVREPLPDALAEQIGAAAMGRSRVADAGRLSLTVASLVWNALTLDRRVRVFARRLDDALAPPDPPLAARREDELVAHYRDLRSRLLLQWDAPLVNDFFTMIFYGWLRRLTQAWCGDAHGTLQNDLVGGEGGLASAEPAVRMQRMAQIARSAPDLLASLASGSFDEIRLAVTEVPAFANEYAAYLEKFGDRTINELKLESLTLHDDPLPLLRAVGQLGFRRAGAPASSAGQDRAAAAGRVRALLAGHPLRRAVFAVVLRQARRRVRDRENLRLERTRLFGRVRRIMLELGRRFRTLDLLDDERDVFYLEIEEVLAIVEGQSRCTNVRGLVALRREEFAGYVQGPPPDDRFDTRGVVYRGNAFRHDVPTVARASGEPPAVDGADHPEGDRVRRGIGCSAGMVRGRIRIVRDPQTTVLEEPAILVAEHTDPGWIFIMTSAQAMIIERGSLLSHAAIVARELGIPAVVSMPGVTRWLRDGDLVEVDGREGVVRRLASSDGIS